MGNGNDPGILPRSLDLLFQTVSSESGKGADGSATVGLLYSGKMIYVRNLWSEFATWRSISSV